MVRNLNLTMSQSLYLTNSAGGERPISLLQGLQQLVTLDLCGGVAFSPTQIRFKINDVTPVKL